MASTTQPGTDDGGRRRGAARSHHDDRGLVLVLVAASMLFLLAIAALVVDIGFARQERRRAQVAADASSLAAAQDLPMELSDPDAGTQQSTARTVAANYASLNLARTSAPAQSTPCPADMVVSANTVCVLVEDATVSITTPYTKAGSDIPPHRLVHVRICRPSPAFFSRGLGSSALEVCRQATAKRFHEDGDIDMAFIVLHETACRALHIDDDSELLVEEAGIQVNSRCVPRAISVQDDWEMRAFPAPHAIRVVGEMEITGGDHCRRRADGTSPCMTPSQPVTGVRPIQDPFRDLPEPGMLTPSYANVNAGCPRVPGTTLRVCKPGTHNYRIVANEDGDFKPTFLFRPGNYRLERGLEATSSTCMMSWGRFPGSPGRCAAVPADIEARLSALGGFAPLGPDLGVFLYFPPYALLSLNDGPYFGIKSPTTGPYAGISVFQARNQPSDAGRVIGFDCQAGAKRTTFWVDDGAQVHLDTIYAPKAVLWLEGDAASRGSAWTRIDGMVVVAEAVMCDTASLDVNAQRPPSAAPAAIAIALED